MKIDYNKKFESFFNPSLKADILAASVSLYKLSCKFPYEIAAIIAEEVRARFCCFCCKGIDNMQGYEIFEEAGNYYDDRLIGFVREYAHETISNYRKLNEGK